MNSDNNYDAITFRINSINGFTYQDKLNFLNNCNCCDRHKINKPFVFTFWNETPFNFTDYYTCTCDCRHVSRFICRLYEPPNVIITPTPPSSP
jgi:hypothetical protein